MTLKYQHRFFYAFFLSCLVLALGFIYFISPAQQSLDALKQKETQVNQALLALQPLNSEGPHHVLQKPTAQLSALLSELTWHEVKIEAIKAKSENHYHLKLLGSFHALNNFFKALRTQNTTWWLGDFVLEPKDQAHLSLQADFLLLQIASPLPPKSTLPLLTTSPFCSFGAVSFSKEKEENLINESLKHMKMVGYLEKDQERIAFLSLPDSSVSPVLEGMQIGLEQAQVLAIYPHQLHLRLPNQQKIVLSMLR